MTTSTRLLSLLEAVTTPHPLDRYLELLDPMATVRQARARVVAVRRHPAAVTLTLEPNARWRGHRAGQFVRVGVVIDGVRHTRCYSPAGRERDRTIELTVAAHEGGLVSTHLQDVPVGTVVDITEAAGEFVLPTPRPASVLLVAGGSGITPVLSMLRTLVDEGHRGEVTLLHYARTAADVAHLDEIASLTGGNVKTFLSLTRSDDGDLRGHFGDDHLDVVTAAGPPARTYVCGPPTLLHAVRETYAARGLDDSLFVEQFAPPSLATTEPGDGGTVTFTDSGATAAAPGTSLLEVAESAGLTPEHGCRMGICLSCTTVKVSGCTRNLRTGELDDRPDTPIQLCVTAAAGDVELDL